MSSTAMAFPISRFKAVNVSKVPQRSPFRYPGGKTWLIPHIREWLSDAMATVLIEPFAGGGIVSLTAVMEGLVERAVMVEKDHDVAALWHAALSDTSSLTELISAFEMTLERVVNLERKGMSCVTDHAFRTLVMNRARKSGILAAGASFTKNGENGKGIMSRWYPETLVARLIAIEEYSDRITFFEGDGLELLEPLLRGYGDGVCAFIDPPYTAKGGKRAGARLYTHSVIDHKKLFAILADSNANFLMTYDGATEVIDLVARHNFEAVAVETKTAHHNRLPELVITRKRLFA